MQTLEVEVQNRVKKISPIKGLTRKILIFISRVKETSMLEIRKEFYEYSQAAIRASLSELEHKKFIEVTNGQVRSTM